MKTFLKFANCIAAGLALVAFILLMATPAAVYTSGNATLHYSGVAGIFGGDGLKAVWAGLLAWIFVLLAMLALCALVVLPLLKVNALDKFANLIALCAACLLLLGGIFMFCEGGAFSSVNQSLLAFKTGAGWVIGGILALLGSLTAACPVVLGLLGKK